MAFCARTHMAPAELRFKVLTVQQTNLVFPNRAGFIVLLSIVMFITTLESYFWSNHIFSYYWLTNYIPVLIVFDSPFHMLLNI